MAPSFNLQIKKYIALEAMISVATMNTF